MYQAINSLFGAREVVDIGVSQREKPSWICLHSAPSTFEKYPDICASIVSYGDSITLCVNEDAPKYSEFIKSEIHLSFSSKHPPISHSDLVENRNYLTLKGSGLKRSDDKMVIDYLRKRYSLNSPMFIDMETISVTKETKT
jgi:hypothetical protein